MVVVSQQVTECSTQGHAFLEWLGRLRSIATMVADNDQIHPNQHAASNATGQTGDCQVRMASRALTVFSYY